ncbi:SGNH/GDSL hydrolase family protein [Legionella sp. 16cNR16C]|uniref:SGNH/GDSL hydrolase family protein n=1 Tax=Legionella sp. 16cNR16C TaxID=2905656 RepID=UPI001E43B109|nr:SGNH/GDSL hydrolase family protein [Legionella sp. 16cNR16C]MCE3045967.1 SGNH/GDSL hydrolase family protein [Legionella sp. 16cNR16C]
MSPEKISYFVLMGDSLTDRGTIANKYLWGCIPMSWITGLDKKSPDGRFTNGYAWSDHLSAGIAEDFIIKEVGKEYKMDATDISDAVIAHDSKVRAHVQDSYDLDDDLVVRYKGVDFVRNYSEGGLSAHDYSWVPSSSLSRFFNRMVVSTLEEMREKMIKYDETHQVSNTQKKSTLVIEWSGANDLITVNERPTIGEAKKALKARVENVEELIKKGYSNFILFNLPDLSFTPMYQQKSEYERDNAQSCSLYFNEQLRLACNELKIRYPNCSIECFDINSLFTDIIQHPLKWGFDPEKVSTPYYGSEDFYNENGSSPAKGYIFWDTIHPSADMHALLAHHFYLKYQFKYNFIAPDFLAESQRKEASSTISELRRQFIQEYGTRLAKDKNSFFGSLYRSNIDYKNASLEEIFRHALYEKGYRTRASITHLNWIDKKGNITLKVPPLETAKMVVEAKEGIRRNPPEEERISKRI